jgi:hypothetical protein
MPLQKTDMEQVLFIRYGQEGIPDLENLKNELFAESNAGKQRDTVLEFVDGTMVYSIEIGIIVQFVKKLLGTDRKLRLVVSNYVQEMLTTMNIHKIPNIIIYNSLEEAQEQFPGVDFGVL